MSQQSEEQKIAELQEDTNLIKVYQDIPYSLIRQEVEVGAQDVIDEITEICKYYTIYKNGKSFTVEGTNGDYIPARLRYKMAASLVNKEARFLFAEKPDITIEPKGNIEKSTEESRTALTIMQDLINTVLNKNHFEDLLVKAARDCFIGKRVGCLVNFNEDDGVTITFLKSTQFIYETKMNNPNVLTKFVSFTIAVQAKASVDRRIFKKKFEVDDDGKTYFEEAMYNGAGELVEEITERQELKLGFIPAVVIINDGLTNETTGESEIDLLMDYEMWYSKLSNADKDAQRKSMNPTKYVVDMEPNSTKNLSTSPGSLWDLGSDQNLDNKSTMVGMLEPSMSYSDALETTLNRIKTAGYEQVDIPNITMETLQGSITSGKALKAIYWPLIVRCKEKMKTWGPNIESIVEIIIAGAMAYPRTIRKYTNDVVTPVDHEVSVKQNTPLPEDEIEEKTTDLAEVESSVLSKKSYMQKWRGLTDDEVNEELQQIAFERQVLEDSSFNNGMNGDNNLMNAIGSEDFSAAGVNAIKKDGTQDASTNNLESQTQTADGQDVSMGVGDGTSAGSVSSITAGQPATVQREVKQLNGTQVSSLINILTNYRNGLFTRNQAASLIRSLGLDELAVEELLDEEEEKKQSNVVQS